MYVRDVNEGYEIIPRVQCMYCIEINVRTYEVEASVQIFVYVFSEHISFKYMKVMDSAARFVK